MKCILWGTGKFYNKFRKLINADDVVFLVDSNSEKAGNIIDGHSVFLPEKIQESDFDYIVVLVKNDAAILEWLRNNGVSRERILRYSQIGDIARKSEIEKIETVFSGFFRNGEKKKIAFFSPGLSMTGAPIASLNLCKVLKTMGFDVMFLANSEGPLASEVKLAGIELIEDITPWLETGLCNEYFKHFDVIFFSSIVLSDLCTVMIKHNKPIVWWIHESDETLYQGRELPNNENIFYYGVGNRVLKKFEEKYPEADIENLYYCLPEKEIVHEEKNRLKIAMIGTLSELKGQDVFIDAIHQLSACDREKAVFFVIGTGNEKEEKKLRERCINDSDIIFTGELTQKEIDKVYSDLFLLICPSRCDSMPIVVTQAAQYSVPCILSDQVGHMVFLNEYKFAKVFESEKSEQLSNIMAEFINMPQEEVNEYSLKARKLYDNVFSERQMQNEIDRLINKVMYSAECNKCNREIG